MLPAPQILDAPGNPELNSLFDWMKSVYGAIILDVEVCGNRRLRIFFLLKISGQAEETAYLIVSQAGWFGPKWNCRKRQFRRPDSDERVMRCAFQ